MIEAIFIFKQITSKNTSNIYKYIFYELRIKIENNNYLNSTLKKRDCRKAFEHPSKIEGTSLHLSFLVSVCSPLILCLFRPQSYFRIKHRKLAFGETKMNQKTVLQHPKPQHTLSLNIENIDSLFPGFMLGDFAVISGSSSIKSLLTRLCVCAQLPYQLGGLKTNVLFIDGSNSFRLYHISTLAQNYELNPKDVLEKIFVSRAFTAYQHVSLILEQLEEAIKQYDSKLVILSNPAQLYLDKDVQKKEAEEVFVQLATFLSEFATKNQVIVVVSHSSGFRSKRNMFFKETLCKEANVVASIQKSKYFPKFVLEKHPFFQCGTVEFAFGEITLHDFVGD